MIKRLNMSIEYCIISDKLYGKGSFVTVDNEENLYSLIDIKECYKYINQYNVKQFYLYTVDLPYDHSHLVLKFDAEDDFLYSNMVIIKKKYSFMNLNVYEKVIAKKYCQNSFWKYFGYEKIQDDYSKIIFNIIYLAATNKIKDVLNHYVDIYQSYLLAGNSSFASTLNDNMQKIVALLHIVNPNTVQKLLFYPTDFYHECKRYMKNNLSDIICLDSDVNTKLIDMLYNNSIITIKNLSFIINMDNVDIAMYVLEKFVLDNEIDINDNEAYNFFIEDVIINNKLDMVKMFINRLSFSPDNFDLTDAIRELSANGHIKMLKLLKRNYDNKKLFFKYYSEIIIDTAADNGHYLILNWILVESQWNNIYLNNIKNIYLNNEDMHLPINLPTQQDFFERFSKSIKKSKVVFSYKNAINNASIRGDTDMLDWFLYVSSEYDINFVHDKYIIDKLLRIGNVTSLKWWQKNFITKENKNINIDMNKSTINAFKSGRIDILDLWYEICKEVNMDFIIDKKILKYTTKNNMFNILDWCKVNHNLNAIY